MAVRRRAGLRLWYSNHALPRRIAMLDRHTTDPAAAELLLEREAQGLQVPALARIGLALFGGFTALDGIPSLATRSMIWALIATVIAQMRRRPTLGAAPQPGPGDRSHQRVRGG